MGMHFSTGCTNVRAFSLYIVFSLAKSYDCENWPIKRMKKRSAWSECVKMCWPSESCANGSSGRHWQEGATSHRPVREEEKEEDKAENQRRLTRNKLADRLTALSLGLLLPSFLLRLGAAAGPREQRAESRRQRKTVCRTRTIRKRSVQRAAQGKVRPLRQ